MPLLRVLPALTVLFAARAIHAQATCPVDVYQPVQLAQAGINISKAAQIAETEAAMKPLRDAMKSLQDDRKLASNMVGAGFLRAQLYILWLHQPGQGDLITRERLGDKGVKTEQVDLVAAADSLLKQVEMLDPVCASETVQWRGSKPWTDRINKAYEFLKADNVDSATYYANRSAMLYPTSPFVYNIQAQLANKRGETQAMLGFLRKAITEAEKDTSLAETTKQMQFQLAQTAQGWAMTGGAADKAALFAEALTIFKGILKASPGTAEGTYAFSSAAEIVQLAQDSAGVRDLLAPMVADPSPYSDFTLLLAADLARNSNRNDDGMKLYEATLAKNPNIRDANYFLAFMYYNAKQPDKMMPLTDRLMAIDPSNGDNFLMRAYAYQLMVNAERDARKKAEFQKLMDEFAAKETAMAGQHKLVVTRFERRTAGAALGGHVENLGKAPKAFTVKMDFLDLAGNVVETMTAEIPAVKPGERGEFELVPTKPGIVAYKYEALK
jgi:tetratricopeptide (TPR) repeat protein